MDEERLNRIESAISQLCEVVTQLCEKMDAIDCEVDKLGKNKIFERLDGIEQEFGGMVGGLGDIIDGRKRREYDEGFRGSHPEFGRYEGVGKRLGMDVYGIAADKTYGAPEEEREGIISSMLGELKEKFDDLVDALESHNAHEAAETPAVETAEHSKEPEVEGPEEVENGEVDPKIIDIARQFRGRKVG